MISASSVWISNFCSSHGLKRFGEMLNVNYPSSAHPNVYSHCECTCWLEDSYFLEVSVQASKHSPSLSCMLRPEMAVVPSSKFLSATSTYFALS